MSPAIRSGERVPTARRVFRKCRGLQHCESQQHRRDSFDRRDDIVNNSSTAHIERNDLTAHLIASQNGRNHGERANDLQADEKTNHPFSRAFHGSS
jgi:hypothetical protein